MEVGVPRHPGTHPSYATGVLCTAGRTFFFVVINKKASLHTATNHKHKTSSRDSISSTSVVQNSVKSESLKMTTDALLQKTY